MGGVDVGDPEFAEGAVEGGEEEGAEVEEEGAAVAGEVWLEWGDGWVRGFGRKGNRMQTDRTYVSRPK